MKSLISLHSPFNKYTRASKNIYASSSLINNLFFVWGYRLLSLLQTHPFRKDAFPKTTSSLLPLTLSSTYSPYQKTSLLFSLLRINFSRISILLLLWSLSSLTEFLLVILVKKQIDYFDPSIPPSKIPLYQLSTLFIFTQLINILITNQHSILQRYYSCQSEIDLSLYIFNHLFISSPSSFARSANEGEIMNLIQVDAGKFGTFIEGIPSLIITPFLIGGYLYLLFSYFGKSFAICIGIIIIVAFITVKVLKRFSAIEEMTMKEKDERMKLTKEIFDNLRMIKSLGWEEAFAKKVMIKREDEVKYIKKDMELMAFGFWLFWFAPSFISIISIGLNQVFNNNFNLGNLIVGVTLLTKMQDPLSEFPSALSALIEALVSLRRIERFLKQMRRNEKNLIMMKYDAQRDYAIKITNGTFTWGMTQKNNNKNKGSDANGKNSKESSTEPLISKEKKNEISFSKVLENISLNIKIGECIAIVGEIGSGKSSLFHAILNDLILLNPSECDGIHINGTVGYASQSPFIQNASIRDNILFFNEYNELKYNEVISLSQLSYDLSLINGGDLTEVGDRGASLSSGQRARVALARLLYQQPDIFLFDQIFSALDSDVGEKILNNCIVEYLHNKTRIIITHEMYVLKKVDRIVVIEKGRIKWSGKFNEFIKEGIYEKIDEKDKGRNKEMRLKEKKDEERKKEIEGKFWSIIDEEEDNVGGVKWKVYIRYWEYLGGLKFFFIVMVLLLLFQVFKNGSDLCLTEWSIRISTSPNLKWHFFLIYSFFEIGNSTFILIRSILFVRGASRLALSLHEKMLHKLINASIPLFHDRIPRSQIITRLSNDLSSTTYIIFHFGSFLMGIIFVFGCIIVCCIFIPFSLLLAPLVAIIGFFLSCFYLKGARRLARLEKALKAPSLNTINETIYGLTTISSLNKIDHYKKRFYQCLINEFNADVCANGIEMWFNQQFDFVSFVYMVCIIILIVKDEEKMTRESVAIMLIYAIMLQKSIGLSFSMGAGIEMKMVSMERCMKYLSIREEGAQSASKDEELIKKGWPNEGNISFKNISIKYNQSSNTVLKNININIPSKAKIGIVGRTGSGKSTLALSLLRIVNAFEGSIEIDGIDISSVGLDLLRKNITLLSQEPFVFSGKLNENVDILNLYDKERLKELFKFVRFEREVDFEIDEKGGNISEGEKQIICVIRALMRKTKIVIMDEVTGNIDQKNEERVLKLINEYLNDATVITIAHRISTVIGCDRVIVLDNGEVVEYDTPKSLLNNKSSKFYELYSKSCL